MATSDAAAELHARLEESLWDLVTSQDWLAAMQVAAKFHDYSFANSQLIAIEARRRGINPTRVAGYRKWQELGRQVRRGEKGIPILAPLTRKTPRGHDTEPDQTAPPTPDQKEDTKRLVGFRVVHVFDISQTEGEPLPVVTPQHVTGDLPEQWDQLTALIAAEGFTLSLADAAKLEGANGVTLWDPRRVVLSNDLSGAQRFKTAAHELAHIRLHNPRGADRPECRGIIEVEAESVAYIVCGAAGIDTADYSLPYVATWARGNPTLMTTTAQRVVDCARNILPALETQRTIEPPELVLGPGGDTAPVRIDTDTARLHDLGDPGQGRDESAGSMYTIDTPDHGPILTRNGGCASCGKEATHLVIYDRPGETRPGRASTFNELACKPHADRARRAGAMAYPRSVLPERLPDARHHTAPTQTTDIEAVLHRAIDHYRAWLSGAKGQPARQHLADRKFTNEVTEQFQLGYAPAQWQTLTNGLRRDGFTAEELIASGVVARARSGRLYDTLRGRLIFPIHDPQGHPCGFAGRLIEGDGPKYLNTRATHLYRKSELLYAHHHAQPNIIDTRLAVLVEGYLDAIAAHQAGITNTVAAGGTAITTHHLAALRRTTHNITLTLDADPAGATAARRVHDLAAAIDPDLNIRAAALPPGRDPADLTAGGDAAVLSTAIDEAVPLAVYVVDRILDRPNLDHTETAWTAIRDASAIVVGITNPELRTQVADLIAQRLDWHPTSIERALDYHISDTDQLTTRRAVRDSPALGRAL